MDDNLQTTGASADTGSTAEGALVALDTTPSVDNESLASQELAPTALDQPGQVADFDSIISAVPVDDADLEAVRGQQHYQALIDQRAQLRTLSKAVRELTPLQELAKLGSPKAIQGKLQLANLLYSPVLDAQGQPLIDPTTQTPYKTTLPFIQRLDQDSPGMPEQLLSNLLDFETVVNGQPRKMSLQVLDYWDAKFPNWWKNRYSAQIAPVTGAVTPEELAEIPAEYHAAYRTVPPSIRMGWSAYDEADRTRMLEDYKGKLEDADAKVVAKEAAKAKEAEDGQRLQVYIASEQAKYFDTVRRERFGAISQTLAKQLTFSEDPATNSIMHGAVGTILWNLIDPDGRFIAEQHILKPLGVKLDTSFDAALNRFNTSASAAVANAIAGDRIQAANDEADAMDAADQLVAKLGIIALKVAEHMGAKQAAEAVALGNQLGAATTVRPNATFGISQTESVAGNLPAGMRPDSPEALRHIAERTNFVRA